MNRTTAARRWFGVISLLALLAPQAGAQPLPYPDANGMLTYEQLLAPLPDGPSLSAGSSDATVSVVEGTTSASSDALTGVDPAEPEVVLNWYQPSYWFGPTPWDSGFELGLNGASGTSESVSFRTGGFIKRAGDDYKFNSTLYYNKTNSEGIEIQSNALLDVRYDWLFGDSPWTIFLMSQTFYDEFQAFDINFNVNSGVGYRWLKTERNQLTTSLGTGASREFGGSRDEWVAEANFGINYELKLTEGKKFYAKMDYFPEWEDFNAYRVLSDVGLEIELNQPSNMSLKFSATDRYDSDPEGVSPHNLNYSALLILKL
ncbi:DUF481 domain-containing protein [Botrimarina hoheduenensis]|uniref:DUF481 domain-containing protein n=1 Tax=Botrimarina hoheduenensis TaxID=2528000 RepID=A0A5C5W988_9BACT|nr:DUF481 domain-containing protein [Botrimarina hoheduenensis]TWT47230.1 hypothetical protein Pla111_08420 [Botrimarina hoheduenensis]